MSAKKIQKPAKELTKKQYQLISFDLRLDLIDLILVKGQTIKAAAEQCNIGFSSAKMILHIFRHEGRLDKKKKYTKIPKEYKDGIFNRTVIQIQQTLDKLDKTQDKSQFNLNYQQNKECYFRFIL